MKDRWQKIISGVSQTNDNFSDSLQELIQYTCPKSDAFLTQREHLLNAKKNRETTVQDFCERLEVLNSYSQHLRMEEDFDDVLDDNELKRAIYKAMPKAFRDDYQRACRKLVDVVSLDCGNSWY